MEIIKVEIDKVKPDPNQPRKVFDEEAVKAMAISIKNEGIINPIEVDKDLVIITGEMRWRGAKMAGLKEIPIKIIEKIGEQERFIRQVQENIHQNAMSALDTAKALEKIRNWISAAAPAANSKHLRAGKYLQTGCEALHKLLGTPASTIKNFLQLLEVKGELKEALKDPKFNKGKVLSLRGVPLKYQKKMEHLVVTQKNIGEGTVRNIVNALKRADEYDEDEKAEKVLEKNYEGLSPFQVVTEINKIVPTEEARIKGPADALKHISAKIIELVEFLDDHSLKSFDDFHRPLVIRDINSLGIYLNYYLKEKDTGEVEIKPPSNPMDKKVLLGLIK